MDKGSYYVAISLIRGGNAMAKNETRRIAPSLLEEDKEAYNALIKVDKYSPVNSNYSVAALEIAYKLMQDKQAAETQAYAAYKAARDDANASEWAFHNLMLGGKDQVVAQFGRDSNEVQALGYKKSSEFKKPSKKKTKD
jgi:hypothetical protein